MKIFRNIGIIVIFLFSFFYTEKIANLTLENNKLYKDIKKEASNFEIKPVNALIDGDNITPGLNGKKVNVKTSYFNMKDINTFNSYYLIYDESYPNVSIDDHKDKIINRGNTYKKSVSFVLEYDKKIIDYFINNKIDASVLVDINTFSKTINLEQINNEEKNFDNLETLLNRYGKNTNICYLKDENKDICKKENKYLINASKIVNNQNFINIKNNVRNGDIYYISKNFDIKNMKLLINSIMYKDLDIIRLSKLLSEER